jgi:hypothetical protein
VTYWIDGVQVAAHPIGTSTLMRPLAGDAAPDGVAPLVSWLRLSPYSTSGTYTGTVLDAGLTADWMTLGSSVAQPPGTQVLIDTRSGPTPTPGTGWSAWQMLGAGDVIPSPDARYLQYRARLSTTSNRVSPSLERVSISYRAP